MKIANIDFPELLLNILRDGKLVVFAGAGVSMGKPACLPSFEDLANRIAKGTGKILQDGEPIDRFLGRLQRDGVKVHDLAKEVLDPPGLKATELHKNLLRLYTNAEQVRVVTTNFDLLFEQAAKDTFGSQPEAFQAPALPSGARFSGIVHVHGAVRHSNEMIITDADFGRAYLTEGWAQRFLVDLFRSFTVLFVGYSHKDVILHYLARALPVGEADRRFALIGEKDNAEHWDVLGIKPIRYPQTDKNDYNELYKGVRDIAKYIRRSVLDWQREISAIAEKPPDLDAKTADLIEDALGDATRTQFFTKAASDPKWIDWLDQRKHLNALFEDDRLSEQDEILSQWLTNLFAYKHANKLFLLIGKHNTHLNPYFWRALSRKIGIDEETPLDKDILSRWISLLLATIQDDVRTDIHLLWMGESCIKHGMLGSLLEIFDAMMGSRLQLKQSFIWPDEEDNESPSLDVELSLIGNYDHLERLWKGGLKPELSQVAEPLLERVIKRLEEQYFTLYAWQKANRDWESTSDDRSAIECHEQNIFHKPVDVLINVARDCLERLTSNQIEKAAQWCDRLVGSDAPILRRLAVHAVSKRADLTADNKIDWLLKHIGLHDWCVHHEIFVAVGKVYPKANSQHRESLINSVWAYRWKNGKDSEKERQVTAEQHFDWFDWLHKSDPNCALAKQARDEVLAENPRFKPREHPDLRHGITSGPIGLQSPWTVEELLAKSAANWLEDLLSYQNEEWDGPSRRGLLGNVTEAVQQNFDWGLDLADALAKAGEWDVDLWSVLIRSWSKMALNEDKHRKVLHWLSKTNLYSEYNRRLIADTLYALVREGSIDYALNMLPQANKIATDLWHHLDRNELIEGHNNWLRQAINHPAGILTEFWLSGFSLWRKQQAPEPAALSDEYRLVLSDIVQDQKLPGKLGRTILASHFAFLLAVDETWTRENLLPLFSSDNSDFQAAWDGFLVWGRLSPAVAEVMDNLFLKAIERIDSDLSDKRDQFIKYYTDMLTHFVEDPIDQWIPKLFQYGGQEARRNFALNLGYHLQNMDEAAQQELWQRWLKQYWEKRLQCVPEILEPGEIENMLNWLPHLTAVFSEAVDLAVKMQMPLDISLQHCRVINEINKSNMSQRYPDEVSNLLIYLSKYNLRDSIWFSKREELIDQLLQQNISPERKHELEEIKAQL